MSNTDSIYNVQLTEIGTHNVGSIVPSNSLLYIWKLSNNVSCVKIVLLVL